MKTEHSHDEIIYRITSRELRKQIKKHNEFVDVILYNFDFTASDYDKELANSIYLSNEFYTNRTELYHLLSFVYNEEVTIDYLLKKIKACDEIDEKGIVAKMLLAVTPEDFNCKSYHKITEWIDSLQELADKRLCGADLLVVTGFFELLKNSAYYWMAKEWGGSGKGYAYLNKSKRRTKSDKPQSQTTSQEIGEIALADAIVMAAGCIVTAVGGAISPVFAAPLLKATVRHAALASAEKALEIAERHRKENDKENPSNQ